MGPRSRESTLAATRRPAPPHSPLAAQRCTRGRSSSGVHPPPPRSASSVAPAAEPHREVAPQVADLHSAVADAVAVTSTRLPEVPPDGAPSTTAAGGRPQDAAELTVLQVRALIEGPPLVSPPLTEARAASQEDTLLGLDPKRFPDAGVSPLGQPRGACGAANPLPFPPPSAWRVRCGCEAAEHAGAGPPPLRAVSLRTRTPPRAWRRRMPFRASSAPCSSASQSSTPFLTSGATTVTVRRPLGCKPHRAPDDTRHTHTHPCPTRVELPRRMEPSHHNHGARMGRKGGRKGPA